MDVCDPRKYNQLFLLLLFIICIIASDDACFRPVFQPTKFLVAKNHDPAFPMEK